MAGRKGVKEREKEKKKERERENFKKNQHFSFQGPIV